MQLCFSPVPNVLYKFCPFIIYLVIDCGAELDQQEAVRHHRKDTQDGGEDDGQPNVGLVQSVPS